MIRKFVVATMLTGAAFGVGIGTAAVATAAPYVNCTAAAADGASDIPSDSEYYGPHLDKDQDGIGCES
jgi:hypothetical protein